MYSRNYNLYCSKNETRNILEKGDYFYEIQPLSKPNDKSKGGNSCVFKLFDSNKDVHYIIKFSKYRNDSKADWIKQRIVRFEREIQALNIANDKNFENVIQILFSGELKIGGGFYRYYVMEKADSDLTDYFRDNDISIPQKILLCYDILKGISELHSLKIYHRDVKPDNLFFINGRWKIGDLGLIDFQDIDQHVDVIREKIGPYGWLSPEAMNKVLCENTIFEKDHTCQIKSYSDIFQMGKIFWYIFQGNIPIGQVKKEDFLLKDENIFNILFSMLQYLYSRRPTLEHLSNSFQASFKDYGI